MSISFFKTNIYRKIRKLINKTTDVMKYCSFKSNLYTDYILENINLSHQVYAIYTDLYRAFENCLQYSDEEICRGCCTWQPAQID